MMELGLRSLMASSRGTLGQPKTADRVQPRSSNSCATSQKRARREYLDAMRREMFSSSKPGLLNFRRPALDVNRMALGMVKTSPQSSYDSLASLPGA
jgi:hypothetical protein